MIEGQSSYSANLYAGEVRTAGDYTGAARNATTASQGGSFIDLVKGFVDIINPLQHIPVISTLYRKMTGDDISPAARIAGGALFGGPLGAAVSMANVAVENATGKDIGETLLALGDDNNTAAPVQVAQAMPAAQSDIIWDDAPQKDSTQFLLSSSPTLLPDRTETAGLTGRFQRSYEEPVHPLKEADGSTIMTEAADEEIMRRPAAEPASFLQSQEVPADDVGTASSPGLIAVPREMIATRMAQALDKYAAMKQRGL